MAIRQAPSTNAKIVAVLYEGAVVKAMQVMHVGGFEWLQLASCDASIFSSDSKGAWMLLDGTAVGLVGELLKPAIEVEEVVGGENLRVIPWDESLHPQSRGHDLMRPRFCHIPMKWPTHKLAGIAVHAVQTKSNGVRLKELPVLQGKCWLIPTTHYAALSIARQAAELRRAGWKFSSNTAALVLELANKSLLRTRAERLGLVEALPKYWQSPMDIKVYPCIIKAADGEHGCQVHIVRSEDAAKALCGENAGAAKVAEVLEVGAGRIVEAAEGSSKTDSWVIQELVQGPIEYATSMLVHNGEILDLICTRYVFESSEYVWPRVTEIKQARRFFDAVPVAHFMVMRAMLVGFQGICNFNYKVRPDGRICIFEVNPRLGADLACDVDWRRARDIWERMDGRLRQRTIKEMTESSQAYPIQRN